MARGKSSTSLAPGFRFHPTDDELVRYYLKRKVMNKPLRFDPISVIDIYKSEPWDLPDKSKLKTRDLEWYFFSALDRKYSNGSKTNRATEKGYWKTTGKDRAISWNSRTIGMKKILVYHRGRAPRGERTNWVMHEYRLADEELEKAGVVQDAFVLSRIFQKSGSGPKNGERYGAPLIEEEWEDDEQVAGLPGEEVTVAIAGDKLPITDDDDVVVVKDNHCQNDIETASGKIAQPVFYQGEASNHVEQPINTIEDDQKPFIGGAEPQNRSCASNEQDWFNLPGQFDAEASFEDIKTAKSSEDGSMFDASYFFDEPYLDAAHIPVLNMALYLESDDLLNPVEPASAEDAAAFDMVDEYLNFCDADDENLTFDVSELLGIKNAASDKASPSQTIKDVHGDTAEILPTNEKFSETLGETVASSSNQNSELTKFESDVKYPFIKPTSHMLGSYPTPPALASPVKDGAIRLYPGQSSSSIHVTAGMIRIESVTLDVHGLDWPLGKGVDVNIILSLPSGITSSFSGKTASLATLGWLFLMFFWVLVLSISYKMGTFTYANKSR